MMNLDWDKIVDDLLIKCWLLIDIMIKLFWYEIMKGGFASVMVW